MLLHRVVLPVHGRVRVRPVGHGHRRPVLLRRGLVVDGQQLHGLGLLGLEVDDGVGAVPLAGVEDEVAVKVPGVQPREGEAVSVAGERGLGGLHGGPRRRRVQVPEEVLLDVPVE